MTEMKHKPEKILLTNMCVIEDKQGNVVTIDKVTGSYRGTTFPGGHIEEGEAFANSVIREVKEETGLIIKNPRFCGVYHWNLKEIHNILFIYYAEDFNGTLRASREGKVYWFPLEELKKKDLAPGTEHVISMIQSERPLECLIIPEKNGYSAKFY